MFYFVFGFYGKGLRSDNDKSREDLFPLGSSVSFLSVREIWAMYPSSSGGLQNSVLMLTV